jgi:hypothetical protein
MKKTITLLVGFSLLATSALAQPAATVPPPAAPAVATVDINQQVTTALAEYQQKNYGKAADALDEASGELRKMKADILVKFLPAAPQGWTIVKASDDASSLSMMGMGSMIERSYQSGGETVKISMITDNKLIGALSSMATLGQSLAGKNAGGMQQFMGHTYWFKQADPSKSYDKENDAQLIVSDKLSVQVSGAKLTEQQAQGFLGMIDLAKLKVEAEK